MNNSLAQRTRSLKDWIYHPTSEDMVCINRFHEVVEKVYQGYSIMDPTAPDPDDLKTKVANLMRAQLILHEHR